MPANIPRRTPPCPRARAAPASPGVPRAEAPAARRAAPPSAVHAPARPPPGCRPSRGTARPRRHCCKRTTARGREPARPRVPAPPALCPPPTTARPPGGRSVMVRCRPSLAHCWISGGVGRVSAGGSAIVGALTVATLACLLRRWVVVFMDAVCSYRSVASGRARTLRSRPFAVRFWDRTLLPRRMVTERFTVRTPAAVACALRAPRQLGIGRAYLAWLLEVDDLDAALDLLADWQPRRCTDRSRPGSRLRRCARAGWHCRPPCLGGWAAPVRPGSQFGS